MAKLFAFRDQLKGGQKEREQLDFLLKMATARMKLYQEQLKLNLAEGGGDSPIKIVGEPVAFSEGYTVNVTSNPDDGIQEAVDSFFKGGEAIRKGFAALVKVGLNAVLGNTSVGEQEQSQVFIAMEHGAVVRVDVKAWRYNFSDRTIIASVENAFCYCFCKSVVDLHKVPLSALVYMVNELAGDDQAAVAEYLEALKKQYAEIKALQQSADALRAGYVTMLLSEKAPAMAA